jgi:hypothetical protein
MLASPALEHALLEQKSQFLRFRSLSSIPSGGFPRYSLVCSTEAAGSDKLIKYSRNEVCHVKTCILKSEGILDPLRLL